MKILYSFVIASLFAFSVHAQNSSETKTVFTQSNGVVVQESSGVEGFVQQTESKKHENPIDNWSLAVCIDALKDIEDKLSTFGNSTEDQESKRYYLEQKRLVEERKQTLLTNP